MAHSSPPGRSLSARLAVLVGRASNFLVWILSSQKSRQAEACPTWTHFPMRKHKIYFVLVMLAVFFTVSINWENAMAQDRGQGRSMVISQTGIVATESPLASKAGAAILERGGNAVDAAIAAHAVMTVVAPMWNGIGGDRFAIVYDAKTGKYYGLNASGWAPAGQSVARLHQQGLRDMPSRGIESATVPGAVDGWQKLLERFGKKKLNEVLVPAIQVAE